jgi:hypothetical protein
MKMNRKMWYLIVALLIAATSVAVVSCGSGVEFGAKTFVLTGSNS